MLEKCSPNSIRVCADALAPSSNRRHGLATAATGRRLDLAVLTTYTLDLEALLALPLAVVAHSDGGVEKLLEDPLLLLQAIRDAGDRIHVFVDETGIAVPQRNRELYATLEDSVHPVRAPGGGVFHPKVWLAGSSGMRMRREGKA